MLYWITSQIEYGYAFLKEGKNIACGGSEKIEDYNRVDEAGCKNKCDADENCTYLWYRSRPSKKCILYSSCDTKANSYKGKLFKKILDDYDYYYNIPQHWRRFGRNKLYDWMIKYFKAYLFVRRN